MTRMLNAFIIVVSLGISAAAQDAVTLVERFDTAQPYRVELRVRINGRLALTPKKGEATKILPIEGDSTLIYDERMIPSDDPKSAKLLRIYQDVRFQRRIDGQEQTADIRPSVRRMVVIRSESGKKVPLSPDGPLTWGEIDVVRTDLFSPALVTGLLPARPVKPGEKWYASKHAVADLTDLDPIEEGRLIVEYVGKVQLNGKSFARLNLSGQVKGRNEDGLSQHRLTGTIYFDLAENRLNYLNLQGTNELLGPDGKVTGRVEGSFQMTRGPSPRAADFSPEVVRQLKTSPDETNSLLLYDNPELGVKLEYPRRWRVGAVEGNQLTLEEGQGASILLTILPSNRLPTAEQYAREAQEFVRSQKGQVLGVVPTQKTEFSDQFSLEIELNKARVRMNYHILSQANGGATAAVRLPLTDRDELTRHAHQILKSLQITRRIDRPN